VAFTGVYPHHGTIQRFKVHPARYVHKLPSAISFRAAALIEPLSVAMHALRTSPVALGTPVAVFGAGPIGLLAMAVARASGAHPIVIADIDQARLDFAARFEPHCRTYRVQRGPTPQQSAREVRSLFGTEEYDMPQVVLECTGVESSICTAAYTARRGGTVNVVGVSAKAAIDNVPFMHMSLAEIKLLFINRYHDTWPAAVRALEGRLIDPVALDLMVTQTFRLEDAAEAMKLVGGLTDAKGEAVVKVQIVDAEESKVVR
jgi:L-iditol 2-dehydrogenase